MARPKKHLGETQLKVARHSKSQAKRIQGSGLNYSDMTVIFWEVYLRLQNSWSKTPGQITREQRRVLISQAVQEWLDEIEEKNEQTDLFKFFPPESSMKQGKERLK